MYSKVKIFGHPLHVMLVGFPVAFYTAALVCFICYNSNQDPFWFKVGYVANVAAVIMAAVAALPGFIDWLFIPSATKAKRTGVFHMLCNVAALLLFGANIWMICDQWNVPVPDMGSALIFTGAGFVLTIIAGFLGWTLVQKHHVGVDMTAGNTP
ncbi:MAG TPA: DUF2231 domain-containing protein [Ferruginibacter sp.]|nr:DUF2231 domain-containing protein [Ferruginibacter sp.]